MKSHIDNWLWVKGDLRLVINSKSSLFNIKSGYVLKKIMSSNFVKLFNL